MYYLGAKTTVPQMCSQPNIHKASDHIFFCGAALLSIDTKSQHYTQGLYNRSHNPINKGNTTGP